jgi:CMP-N,N'-diacetyllegionaminic acid synthase
MGKNLRYLRGKPLLHWTIEQARASRMFAAVAVSSDSEDILEAAREGDVDVAIRRPAELATDAAPKVPAILHAAEEAIRQLGITPDVLVDLDVTSPLRLPKDIVGAVELLERTGATSVITGAPARRSPYFNLVEERPDGTVALSKPLSTAIVRRQDAPRAFDMNASIYVWQLEKFFAHPAVFYPDTRLFEMPEERSIDIDSDLDFRIVELLIGLPALPTETP